VDVFFRYAENVKYMINNHGQNVLCLIVRPFYDCLSNEQICLHTEDKGIINIGSKNVCLLLGRGPFNHINVNTLGEGGGEQTEKRCITLCILILAHI